MMHINPKSRSIQFSSLHKIPNFYEGKHNKSTYDMGFIIQTQFYITNQKSAKPTSNYIHKTKLKMKHKQNS